MAKTITLTYDDAEYTLEYTRKIVERLESEGVTIQNLLDRPLGALPKLFAGAFRLHHPTVRKDVVEEILQSIPDKQNFYEKLIEMYKESYESLFDEPKENAKKAVWGAAW